MFLSYECPSTWEDSPNVSVLTLISLTPVLSKDLEGFVFDWLAPILMPCIDPYQFGNVKKSSTTHALVHLLHY